MFITESDGANFTATATGGGAINLTSTTGALTIAGATSTGSGAITLTADTVNINDSLSSTGALTLQPVTAAGDLTVSSSSSSNLTDGFSSITIGNAAGTGAVTVNALTVSDPLTIRSPTTTGTVTVNGPITGLGNAAVTLTGGTGTTPITLNAGITTAGNAITLNDNVGLGANVMLDSTNGGGSPAGATIAVTGTVNADLAANNRTLTLAGGTAGNVTLSGAVGGTQALQSLTVTSANALTVPAVTTTGDIQLNAQNAVTLNGAVNAGTGTVTINANTDGTGTQSFSMAAGSSITTTDATANAVQINVNAAGGGTGTAALRNITTGSGGTLTVATNTGGNATGGDITQTAGTLLNVGAGTINLTTPAIAGANIGSSGANILTTAGTITASTGTSGIFVTNQTGVDLTGIQTTGPFSLTANGPITGSGPVVVGGTTTLTAGAANSITLNNAANDFSTVGITSGNNVTLVDSNALNLGASTISGTLSVITAGSITDSGNLNVSGAANLAAGAGNDITLNSAGNNFSTVAISSGHNVTLVDSNALDLGASNVSGALNVTVGGAVTESGVLNVEGNTSFTATAANTDILLNTQANNFGGGVSFAGTQSNFRDVALRNTSSGAVVPVLSGLTNLRNLELIHDNAGLSLPALTASGTMNVTTGGTITQSGDVNVNGTTTLSSGANNITLGNAGNNFSTVVISGGNNVVLRDINALDLGASTISGTLSVTTAGALTDSGNLNVTGTTTLAAGTVNDITLDSAANNFSTVVITSGRNVTLVDSNALDLGASTVSGALNVTTNGAITQSGALNVAATTTLSAGAGNNITLNNASNDFSTVAVISGNNVSLADANALDLGTSMVSGNLNVITNGALTQSDAVVVAGATTFAAGAGDVTLDNTDNDFSTVGITSANNVTLQDRNNISLGSSTVTGNFSVAAGGAILDGGGSAINITAATANLTAASNIGTGVDPLETSVGTLNASTTGGGIFVSEANAVTLGNISAGGGNEIVIGNSSGNITVHSVTTAGGAVTLASPGGAIQDGNGAANNVTAGILTISAANGIDLDTRINTLSSANVTGTGFVDISNAGALAVNNVATTNGSIALNATGGDLAINMVTAGGAGDVTFSTTTSGDITLGSVTSPNTLAITSAGGITDNNGAAANISANTADLTASANIGTSGDPIETAVGTLNATATASGIYIHETDTVTLNNIVAGGGNVTISNTAGDMIINSITATAGGIDLTASAGSILDGNGATNNLTGVANSNLRALGGVIGLSTDPIEVNINPGMLGVAATGQVGGVSVDIGGTVLPANAVMLLNSPPGEVIFNSRVLNPSPSNLPNLTGIAAELNPQRVNEDDYFTELLLDVLGNDFVKAKPFYCKLDDSLRVKLDSNLCTEDDR